MNKKLLKSIKKFIIECENEFYYKSSHEVYKMVGKTKCLQGFDAEITINFNVVELGVME